MSAITFDTLKFVKTLKAAGFEEKQAEALAEAQANLLSESMATTLATKSDISEVKTDLAVIKRMIGIVIGGLGSVIVILLKVFFPH